MVVLKVTPSIYGFENWRCSCKMIKIFGIRNLHSPRNAFNHPEFLKIQVLYIFGKLAILLK
jgi:hypothetical protein